MKIEYEKKLATRIGIALLLMLTPTNIVNIIMQKPTIWLSYLPIKIIGYEISVNETIIHIGEHSLQFIQACTATSAYYLLALLILVTKDIGWKKSLKMLITGTLLILLMNVARIDILLVILMERGINVFKSLHLFFWEFVSSLYVAAVWIFLVKKFKVKTIPVISDIKELYKKAKRKS